VNPWRYLRDLTPSVTPAITAPAVATPAVAANLPARTIGD